MADHTGAIDWLQSLDNRTDVPIPFNTFVKAANITYEREAFWHFVREELGLTGSLLIDEWEEAWKDFTLWVDFIPFDGSPVLDFCEPTSQIIDSQDAAR